MVEPEMLSSETGPSKLSFAARWASLNVLLENRKYGSGYPGYPIGVAGYGFPFYFWPLAFSGGYGAHYINDDNEVRAPRLYLLFLPRFVTVNDVSPVRHSR